MCISCSVEFGFSCGKDRFCSACEFVLWHNIADSTVQTLIVVMLYKVSYKAIGIVQRQRWCVYTNTSALDVL